ncbi:MAG TPA: hypothetical protein VLD64_03230 [Nitrosarchaeum sp.]|nr:hypothetical protein [Nitrosarchaeum sp.]
MTDPLIDDVKALLDKEKGDERILKQIFRACENDEVISNYERNYVRNLAEKYLGRVPEVEKQPTEEKPIIPDVIIPKTSPKQNIESPSLISHRNTKSTSKNTKIFLGVGGIIFVILIVIGISFSGVFYTESDNSQITSDNSKSTSLSIKTDLSTYQKGDIISISGTSTAGQVNILIENQDGKLIWSEQISVKNNGRFSTLAIAGGDGWDKSGTFTIKVNDNSETKSKTFSFKA